MLACLACLLQPRLLRRANESLAVLFSDRQLEERYVALRRLPEFLPRQLDLLLEREAVPRASHRQVAVEVEESSVASLPLEQGQAVSVGQGAQEGSVRL